MAFLNSATAAVASYQAGVDRARAADANAGAAHARARATVLARSNSELGQDLVLANLEIQDLEEQLCDAKAALSAEQQRTEMLLSMVIRLKSPSITDEQFSVALASALQAIRQ